MVHEHLVSGPLPVLQCWDIILSGSHHCLSISMRLAHAQGNSCRGLVRLSHLQVGDIHQLLPVSNTKMR